jgi:hypothetical protein
MQGYPDLLPSNLARHEYHYLHTNGARKTPPHMLYLPYLKPEEFFANRKLKTPNLPLNNIILSPKRFELGA